MHRQESPHPTTRTPRATGTPVPVPHEFGNLDFKMTIAAVYRNAAVQHAQTVQLQLRIVRKLHCKSSQNLLTIRLQPSKN